VVLPFHVLSTVCAILIQYGMTGLRPGAESIFKHGAIATLIFLIAAQVGFGRLLARSCMGCQCDAAVHLSLQGSAACHAPLPHHSYISSMQLEHETGLPLIRMSAKQRELMMAPHHLEPFCDPCRCLQAVDIV